MLSSIAELIATGEAWDTDVEDFHALHAPLPAAAELVVPVAPVPAPVTPPVLAMPTLPVAAALPPAAPPLEPQPRRVQLGFRDGTSANLDPASSQFQALEQLAQSLTRRD